MTNTTDIPVIIHLETPATHTSTQAPLRMEVHPDYKDRVPEGVFDIQTEQLVLSHGTYFMLNGTSWAWYPS